MNYKGWIMLKRSIKDHWLWDGNEAFDKAHAWIDILLSVNHCARKIVCGEDVIEIEKGAMLTSEVKLSQRWSWSRKKVSTFLKLLEKENMIQKKRVANGTYIKVLENEASQGFRDNDLTAKEQPKNTQRASKEHPRNTNNNDNNVKNDNKFFKSKQKKYDLLTANETADEFERIMQEKMMRE